MLHMRLSDYPDDRELAVVYQRERLVFTDPPYWANRVTALRQERAFRRRAGPPRPPSTAVDRTYRTQGTAQ